MAERAALGYATKDGCEALRLANLKGHDGVLSILLRGANKDALDCDGERPLIWAVMGGHERMMETLVAAGVNVNVRRGADGCAALHLAADEHTVSTLLRKGAYKDVLDNKGRTPLMKAAERGHKPVVEALLAAGANFNIRSKEDGFSALHHAARKGDKEIVFALLRSGADVGVVDNNGDTALMWAAELGHQPVVETLLDAGADASIGNAEGYSAIDRATKEGHAGVLQAIHRRLAGVDANDEAGCTDPHLPASTDQANATPQARVEELAEFDFGGQTKTAESGSLTEGGGGGSLGGLLAVPAWLDLEGICLAICLFLWFTPRCKRRG